MSNSAPFSNIQAYAVYSLLDPVVTDRLRAHLPQVLNFFHYINIIKYEGYGDIDLACDKKKRSFFENPETNIISTG